MEPKQKVIYLFNAGLLNAALGEMIAARLGGEECLAKAMLLQKHNYGKSHPNYENWVMAVKKLLSEL